MTIRDFLQLHGGEQDECVELYECDTTEEITAPVADILENDGGIYTEILSSDIASWEYDDCTLCILYFKNC